MDSAGHLHTMLIFCLVRARNYGLGSLGVRCDLQHPLFYYHGVNIELPVMIWLVGSYYLLTLADGAYALVSIGLSPS